MEGVCYGEESDVVSQTRLLSEFDEDAEVRAVISSLPDIHHDPVCRENTFEKFVGESSMYMPLHNTYYSMLCVCLKQSRLFA